MTAFSTATLPFELESALEASCEIYVTFEQKNTKLTKKITTYTVDGNLTTFEVTLTQAETGLFKEGNPVLVQVNVLTSGGDRIPSDIIEYPTFRNLLDEVVTYGA